MLPGQHRTSPMNIRFIVSGRNYNLADSLPDRLSLEEGAGVTEAIAAVERLLPRGSSLPASCLVAVSGIHLGTVGRHSPRTLRDGDELVLIAPVAGG